MREIAYKEVHAAQSRTSTGNGSVIDLQGLVNAGGREMKAIMSIGAVTGTNPTMTVKFQQGDESDGSDMADITGAAFTQATAAGNEAIHFQATKRYVRCVYTLGGTSPNFTFAVVLLGMSRITN